MSAILGGLGAALAFATATIAASRAARLIGARQTLAWVMLVGFCVVVPWALLEGSPTVDGRSAAWLVASGAGNVIGLLLAYSALRRGKVGVVAPILSTEGAIAAVIAVVVGETISAAGATCLAAIAVGILLSAARPEPVDLGQQTPPSPWRVPAYAVAAACSFGVSIYATGRASAELPIGWAVLPPRLIGVLVLVIPLAAASSLRVTRKALPLVLIAGIAEVAGFALFAFGARGGIAVAAVLASQFAAISGIAAYFLFRERLSRLQLVGVVTIVGGVAVLTVVQAG